MSIAAGTKPVQGTIEGIRGPEKRTSNLDDILGTFSFVPISNLIDFSETKTDVLDPLHSRGNLYWYSKPIHQ